MADQIPIITPTTAETPLEENSTIKAIGAQVIGSEELESKIKDAEYIMEADFKKGDKVRTTESKGFFRKFLDRIARHRQASEQIQEQ